MSDERTIAGATTEVNNGCLIALLAWAILHSGVALWFLNGNLSRIAAALESKPAAAAKE